ncbi:heavy metal translocating P-type ATPase [Yoonia sediminilitoris]|uniref:Cu+-exporting ATPase n=1 Tax=Yoonia sediminilitoris TaxID=1286148 RepID=A0A2T6K7Q4_9RHOB|nr:heavy metal translocating P-type ATPase [Yoonia sediminilitoris]PUB10714.1 Cu+-exporting ATPase [Yoonia sediminilitoris]RCW90466.1 Cu+-exporting ATPase [Yoonia sediminilitoris]
MTKHSEIRLAVDGMSCASCVGRVETALKNVPGVEFAQVNLADGTARIVSQADADANALKRATAAIGYDATVLGADETTDEAQATEAEHLKRSFLVAMGLTFPVFLLEMGGHLIPALHDLIMRTIGMTASWTVQFILATLVIAGPGRIFYVKGIASLRHLSPDMNALVVLGTAAAWTYSTCALFLPGVFPAGTLAVYFEAAAVIITLILLGRWLEARAKGQTGAAIKRLIGLRPATATVLRDGDARDIPINEVVQGDMLLLRPGARIAVDGVVVKGQSFVDEAMITGEPMPVDKAEGDRLTAGTVNGNGVIEMRATAVGEDTMLAQIIAMVQDAQGARLPVQDLLNRVTAWFVPAVMAVATLTVLVWLTIGPDPALSYALVAGVSVLIIACPCAMGLAAPTSIMVGTGRAADLGVLFRRGDGLQALQSVDVVAFDKTGTLTLGKPALTDVVVLNGDEETLLRLAAAVEKTSEHPLAQAIVDAATAPLPSATDVQAVPGYGIKAQVSGSTVVVGAQRMLQAEGIDSAALAETAARFSKVGKTSIMVAVDGKAAGVLAVADQLRPNAVATVRMLQANDVKVVMITGDAAQTAQATADDLGITDVIADVLPGGKKDAIAQLHSGGKKVAFVGDGINDAPALAAADVGIAIGTGTDVAVEAADVVLMSGDPAGVANAIAVSKATMANIRQNLMWAFGYNILLVPVAAGVLFPVWGMLLSPALAAGAMALSSVIVVSNALRLRGAKGVL